MYWLAELGQRSFNPCFNGSPSYISMIKEIGGGEDVKWEQRAAERIFYYCGGHPLVTRYFAGDACEKGTLKYIDYQKVEDTAQKIQKTFHKNDIGNYYKEGFWELMNEREQTLLSLISKGDTQRSIQEAVNQVGLENALAKLEYFGLVENRQGILRFTAQLFNVWLKRRLGL